MAFFTPFNSSQFVNFTLSLPMCYSLNFTKKLENEKFDKEIFAYIVASAYRVTSKEVKNQIFRHN